MASLAAVPVPSRDHEAGRGGTTRIGVRALTIPPGTDIPVTIDENIALKRDQFGKTFAAHVTRDAAVGAGGGLAWGLLDKGTNQVKADTPLAFSLRDAVRIP